MEINRLLTEWGCLLVVLFGLAGCQAVNCQRTGALTQAEQAAMDRLLILIDQRLAVAPLVAQAKWNTGDPIDVPEREAVILGQVRQQAAAAGVDETLATAFFVAQFEAGKHIQTMLHEQWQRQQRRAFDPAPDLAVQVRPTLDDLTPRLLTELGALQRLVGRPGFATSLRQRAGVLVRDDFAGRPRDQAIEPLMVMARGGVRPVQH